MISASKRVGPKTFAEAGLIFSVLFRSKNAKILYLRCVLKVDGNEGDGGLF
jgi:hypothetical protein